MPKPGGGNGGGSTIKGNRKDNLLNGTDAAELLQGLAGNDTLNAGGGDDTLEGGSGADSLLGGAGADSLLGGLDDDILDGGTGNDTVDGGDGEDRALLAGAFADFTVVQIDATTVELTAADGTVDRYTNVELFQFTDGTLTFDEVVFVPDGPNLTAALDPALATVWTEGDTISALWSVTNSGDVDAASTGSALYLSTDAAVTTDDLLLTSDLATGVLSPGASTGEGGGFTVTGLAPGTYWVAAIADNGSTLDESDETDNVSNAMQITVVEPPKANLTASGLTITDTAWDVNEEIGFQWTIGSDGALDAGGNLTDLIVASAPDEAAMVMRLTTQYQSALPTGTSDTVSYTDRIDGLAPGTYYVAARADYPDQIDESDETDNLTDWVEITVTDALPDLQTANLTVDDTLWTGNEPVTATWTAQNTGNADATWIYSGLYLSDDATITEQDQLIRVVHMTELAAGAELQQSWTFSALDLAPGTYWLGVIADRGDLEGESDETNNVSNVVEITVPVPQPNAVLQSAAASFSAYTVREGEAVSVTLDTSIANTGSGSFGQQATVATVLSLDAVFSADDIVIDTRLIADLAPGETLDLSLVLDLPTDLAPGVWNIGQVVDYDGMLDESDETDNAAFALSSISVLNTVIGTEGADTLAGSDGDDAIDALGGDDTVIFSPGGDALDGGEGFDLLDFSGQASGIDLQVVPDLVLDGSPQTYTAFVGDTTAVNFEAFVGSAFDDLFAFRGASDALTIQSGGGADYVEGGEAADMIDGGAGDDGLGGGNGDDTLTGGEGADQFWVERNFGGAEGQGHDTVLDFDLAADIVVISYFTGDTVPDPLGMITDTVDGALVTYADDGASILLSGVDATDLTADHFMLYEFELPGPPDLLL